MIWRLVVLFLCAMAAFGANIRLYLKDGTYQMAGEYQVQQDRVRYYSTERGEWEEIPLELVDLERTKKEAGDRERVVKEEAKAQAEEDNAIRAEAAEIARIPAGEGVYYLRGEKLEQFKAAETKVVNDKKRSVLKVLSPVPLVPGKSTVEIDGETAPVRVGERRPEFYFRLSAEQRFAIIRLTPKKNLRIVETVNVLPVTNEKEEHFDEVACFRRQVGDLLFKIWPEKDLDPGEYALVEYTEGKMNLQIWDFSVR
jgi:hypothetical protein